MSIKKYKFVSPGVFINEIDRSVLPAEAEAMGPVIIGRTQKGPGMRPIKVRSYEEYVRVFGRPIAGGGSPRADIWREGNSVGPTYAPYAAKAWLAANTSPVNVVRLLGAEHQNKTTAGRAGWDTSGSMATLASTNGGAYGLFIAQSGSHDGIKMDRAADAATLVDAIDTTGVAESDAFVITVPTAAGGESGPVAHQLTFVADATAVDALTSAINWGVDIATANTAAKQATAIINAINGTADSFHGYAGGAVGTRLTPGTLGITAAAGSTDTKITLTMDDAGTAGNVAVLTRTTGFESTLLKTEAFSGGADAASADTAAAASAVSNLTGTLAAVFYVDSGALALSGSKIGYDPGFPSTVSNASGSAVAIKQQNSAVTGIRNAQFKLLIKDTDHELTTGEGWSGASTVTFDFNKDSATYARKVFNTNPQLVNGTVTPSSQTTNYWLGETYERAMEDIAEATPGAPASATYYAVLLPLQNASGYGHEDNRAGYKEAKTGWFFSQDLGSDYATYGPSNMSKLFRLVARDSGEDLQRTAKVSIDNLKYSRSDEDPYGTFSVVIRHISDTDDRVQYIEQFNNCNLNPQSENYVARKIGDMYHEWDNTENRWRTYGTYAPKSDLVYIEMDPTVDEGGADANLLPFGVYGPTRYKSWGFVSGSTSGSAYVFESHAGDGSGVKHTAPFVKGNASPALTNGTATNFMEIGTGNFTGSFDFPAVPLRKVSTEGGTGAPSSAQKPYWGACTHQSASTSYDVGTPDYLRPKPVENLWAETFTAGTNTDHMWVFTLDDVCKGASTISKPDVLDYYLSGSRAAGGSISAVEGSYKDIIDRGYDAFTTVFAGGFDGLNITEQEPFRNSGIGSTARGSYTYHSIERAINAVSDPEVVECNVMTIPGINKSALTDRLIDVCEARADALAVIDLENDYVPFTEGTDAETARRPNVSTAITSLTDRALNSSYGACYFPWVQMNDGGQLLWVPPSVPMMGVMASTQETAAVWFAPAGFNRGGLNNEMAAGVNITRVSSKLTSRERDDLYAVNINPIADFPNEGVVVFGQKTLQVTPSALDRINVRRLMIFLKKQISRIAAGILFEQNVEGTWVKFRGEADAFLAGVKAGLGLTDYKIVLDETTTTADLIDRNILYAKIFLKPARAIEFIAIDFIITRTGASFDD